MVAAVFAREGDDARGRGGRVGRPGRHPPSGRGPPRVRPDHESTLPGLHPTRSARLVADGPEGQLTTIGSVGEVDPDVAVTFGVTRTTGGAASARRVGWLEVDLGLLLDETVVPRRLASGGAVSRFPSSDIDLALVVDDRYPADAVADSLRAAAGDVLESVRLFDVYRGPGIAAGRVRSPIGFASAHRSAH